MNTKEKRQQILSAAENAIDELIKVMNKKMDLDEVDPEKVKISASAYRLAMDDAISMMDRVEELKAVLDERPIEEKKTSFFGVESKVR